jgi:hypothetical protein
MFGTVAALCGALAMAGHGPANANAKTQIRGDYLEARTADVYTGPCFSNAEVFITGDKAVMAWKVTEGAWDGVDLSGLSVAAAVKGSTTFSEDDPAKARAVVIVDEKADRAQREALVSLAKHLAGERLSKVVDVRTSAINLNVEAHAMAAGRKMDDNAHKGHVAPHAPRASLWVPGLAEILTRPLDEGDHACGNEVVAYEPLSKGVDVLPAYTLGHHFRGKGLDSTWDDPNCRSSFVGHFAY